MGNIMVHKVDSNRNDQETRKIVCVAFCVALTSLQDIEEAFFSERASYLYCFQSFLHLVSKIVQTQSMVWPSISTNHLRSLFSDELSNLANGNGLTLVTEGESA